jgi:hypothetical protein
MEDKKLELYDVVKYSKFRLKISESNNNYIITYASNTLLICTKE